VVAVFAFRLHGMCGALFLHHHYSFLSRDVGLADPHGDFHTWGSHAVIGVGIFPAGFNRYARGVDDVVLSQNQPPVCNAAEASIATRWSPNHQLVPIDILGVTDPDGAPVTITVDGIFQDEPGNGLGDGDTAPDGAGAGTSVAQIRAERAGGGNGCFYQISFTADDGNGGECQGSVLVGVPKSQAKNGAPVDDGALFDSTTL
jgi:hypothetical protein